MDEPWSTDKLQKILSNDTIPLNVNNASGDCCSVIYICRICGGCSKLRCFCNTHVWDGVEKRYDQLLYEVFGIRPYQSEMICECCIRQLRNIQRFRAMVLNAFAKPLSGKISHHSKTGKGEGITQKNKNKRKMSNVELLKKTTRTTIDKDNIKKRHQRKSIYSSTNVQVKRTNIACAVCKQKYPMIVPFEGWKNFVCSRCKKNNSPQTNRRKHTISVSSNAMGEHVGKNANDVRGKTRVCSIPRLPRNTSQTLRKDSSTGDSKHYMDKQFRFSSLNTKRSSIQSNVTYTCDICGKDNIKNRDLLDKHMRKHTGQSLYRCDVCSRVFKGKSAFQIHYLTHGK